MQTTYQYYAISNIYAAQNSKYYTKYTKTILSNSFTGLIIGFLGCCEYQGGYDWPYSDVFVDLDDPDNHIHH